jgi:ATP-dependent DNA helicase RecG
MGERGAVMTKRDIHALLDELRAMPAEVEWVEFKEAKTHFEPETLGRYFSALANEANLKLQSEGWLILGVHDKKKSRGPVGAQDTGGVAYF